jgi:phage terminase large subunit
LRRAAKERQRTDAERIQRLVIRSQYDAAWAAENVFNLRALPNEPTLDEDPQRSWELDVWQRQLCWAFSDIMRKKDGLPTKINHSGLPWLSVVAMHGPGKTFTAALFAHLFQFCFKGRVVVTAPKFSQLKTRFMGEFRRILARSEHWYQSLVKADETQATWCDDKNWRMMLETAKHPENAAGHHAPYILIIVEEATGVPESLWPVIFGWLSTGVYPILLMISNPTKRTGTFARSHLSPTEGKDYFRMQLTLAMAKRVSRDWAAKLKRKYGETSPIYQIRVLGKFAADDALQLVATEWITAAFEREIPDDGSIPRLRVSVDVGDGGEDPSVITAAHHFDSFVRGLRQKEVAFPAATANQDTADAAERMFDLFGGRKGTDDFVVDATGVGTGVAGELVKRGHAVVRHKGGEGSADTKRWKNRRTQNYLVGRDALRDGLVMFNDDFVEGPEEIEAFMIEMCSVKRKFSGDDKYEELVTREEMRRDGIPSPNRPDSWMMQYSTRAPVEIPGAQSGKQDTVVVVESEMLSGFHD